MIVVKNNLVCPFDVDDTLIMWDYNPELQLPEIEIIDDTTRYRQTFQVHEKHVNRIKQLKLKGEYIIVWSQGGYDWCRRVVEALGLTEFVDLCLTKPSRYYDDYPVESFMERRYISNDYDKRINI